MEQIGELSALFLGHVAKCLRKLRSKSYLELRLSPTGSFQILRIRHDRSVPWCFQVVNAAVPKLVLAPWISFKSSSNPFQIAPPGIK